MNIDCDRDIFVAYEPVQFNGVWNTIYIKKQEMWKFATMGLPHIPIRWMLVL